MAKHTITTDTNIHDLSWTDNDDVVVKEGATFTIDNKGNGLEIWKIGYIKVEYGHLQIDNTTQDGMELLFDDYVFIDIKAEGTMTIDGQLVKIHTSDGTSGQTFKFWDPNYKYQITGLFVDGEHGMLMDAFSGVPSHPNKNQHIRLHKYDKDNAEFKFEDYYIPADNTDIYVPNILIKIDGTDDANVGTRNGYIRFELANGISTKGCYHYHSWLTDISKNVSHTDCVFAKMNYYIGIENLTFTNCLTTYDSIRHYGLYVKWSKNVTMNKITYYGKADYESNFGIHCDDWHIFAQRNKNDNITFKDGEDISLNNFNYVYTEAQIRNYKKARFTNAKFRFDDDYYKGYYGLFYCERMEDLIVDNMQICDNFKYNKHLLKWTFNTRRSIFRNSWFDVYHCNDSGYYPDLFILDKESNNNLIYNCGFTNSKKTDSSRNYLYNSTYNNTIMKCDIRNHRYYLMGKNQSMKAFGARAEYALAMFCYKFGCNSSHIIKKDNNGETVEHRLYFRTGLDDWTIEKSSSDITNDGVLLYFKNDGDYVILKQTKESSSFRQLNSITGSYISGNGTGDMSFYISLDKGQTWIEKSDWNGTTFPDVDTEIWMKIVNNKDRANHTKGSIRYVYLVVDIDTNKPDYEPYFLWSEVNFVNLPEPMYGSFQVSGENIRLFETQNNTYLHYELWKEDPNSTTAKIRKYGYSFYESQSTFNDTSLEFFYTGYQKSDITMSRDDALAISGIVLQSSSDSDYTWELDCNNKSLEEVYHYIQAKLTYHNTDLAGLEAFTLNDFLVRDGNKFKTVQIRNGEGVKLINIDEKEASKIQKDDGTYYEYPLIADITAPNFIDGTRVQIYNITKDVELDNSLISGTDGYIYTSIVDASHNLEVGDNIRLRATRWNGTKAKLPIETTLIMSESGIIFSDIQEDDIKHNQLGYNGEEIDLDASSDTGEIKADYYNVQIYCNDDDNLFDSRKFIAWVRYITYLEEGIRVYGANAINYAPDIMNIEVNIPVQIENIKDDALRITGGIWKRTDGGNLIADSSKTVLWAPNERVYTIEVGSGLSTEEHNVLMENLNMKLTDVDSNVNDLIENLNMELTDVDSNVNTLMENLNMKLTDVDSNVTEARDWARKAGSQRLNNNN